MKVLKIAFFHHLPSGGALMHLNDVVRECVKRGHHVDLYTPETAELEFLSVLDIVENHIVLPSKLWESRSSFLNPFQYLVHLNKHLRQGLDFAKLIGERNYDLVYIGQCRVWTEPSLLRYLGQSQTSVLYCQEPKRSFYEQASLDKIKNWPLLKKIWRLPQIKWMKRTQTEHILKSQKVFCNSKFSAENIKKAYPGVDPEVMYIGVDTSYFKPFDTAEKEEWITSVGALDPSKNHGMAIEVAGLKPGGKNFKVKIITDRAYGDTADQLQARAKELNVELDIQTRVPLDVLREVYQKSYVVVYCPYLEPFGLVSIESQACGTPVLGRNEGGIKETLLPGVGGFLYMEDPEDYANKINEWISSPETYQRFCDQARAHVLEHWDRQNLMSALVNQLESYCDQ